MGRYSAVGARPPADPVSQPPASPQPAGPPAAEAGGVAIGYAEREVVHDLDLVVARGEMVALLGPSGSGKTTILSALAGFVGILAGEIQIGGRRVATPGRQDPPERRDVAVVFQGSALWPHMNVIDTVAYPMRRRGMMRDEARRQAAAILERLGIAALADRRPGELSGGEQQRVGLGRALAREAGLLLFDEPTAHLDTDLRERLGAEIAEQRRRTGSAAIYATHDTAEALALADRVVLLRDGRVIQSGSPATVYDSPVDTWAARLTGPASAIEVHVLDWNDGHATIDVAGTQCTLLAAAGAAGDGARSGSVRAIVRPDWVRFGGDVPATVVDVAFRGTHTDHLLVTDAGELAVRTIGPPMHDRGEAVSIAIDRIWVPGDGAV